MNLTSLIPLDAYERYPFFIERSEVSTHLLSTVTVEVFEEILWIAGKLLPRSIQVSRESEHLGPDEISGGDIIRRLSRLLESGYSIALNFVEDLHIPLAKVLERLGKEFGCIASGSLFLSPPHGATFRPHYDAIDVLAIQLEGSKTWRVSSIPTSLPMSKNTYLVADKIDDGEDFMLNPGETLYVPRGKAHQVRATDGFSLHLSVGLGFFHHGAVLRKSLDMATEQSVELRRTNVGGWDRPASHTYQALSPDFIVSDGYRLRIAEQSLHASALSKRSQLPGRLRTLLDDTPLTAETYLEKRHQCELTREYLSDGVIGLGFPGLAAGRFSQSNAFLTFPERSLVSLEFLRDVDAPFRPADITGMLGIDEKLILARRLVDEGLLKRHIV